MPRTKRPIAAPPRHDALRSCQNLPVHDPAEFDRLAGMLPSVTDREALRNELDAKSLWLCIAISERPRGDLKADHALLRDLELNLSKALSALDSLGHHATEALHDRAKRQDKRIGGAGLWRKVEAADEAPVGRERVGWVAQAIEDCIQWAAEAQVGLNLPHVIVDEPDPGDPSPTARVRKPGRPKTAAPAKDAVRDLARIWNEQTGKRATMATNPVTHEKSGAFLEFCTAFIVPIYLARQIKAPNVGALVANVLYPMKTDE